MNNLSCFANLDELKMYAEMNEMNLTKLRHAQVCYLYHVADMKRAEIARITGYALNTLSKLRNDVFGLLEFAVALFEVVQNELEQIENEVAELSSEIEEIEEEIAIIEKTLYRKYNDRQIPMNYLANCGEDIKGEQLLYLIKFFGEDTENPMFSKIGTTTRTVNSRLRDEIRYYNEHGLEVQSADVCKIVNCGELPAESFESFLRALLIKKYPNTWKKNDRFFGVDINTDVFCQMCEQFKNF